LEVDIALGFSVLFELAFELVFELVVMVRVPPLEALGGFTLVRPTGDLVLVLSRILVVSVGLAYP
jgi:hypothetical protein